MNIPDIIEAFINSLDFTLNIVSYSDNGTDTTITVKNAYHARKGLTVTIDSVDYPIKSVTGNDIVIAGVLTPIVVVLQSPFYFHGTPYATNTHIALMANKKLDRTPFIYLMEIIRERFDNKVDSLIDRTAELNLFFLDDADSGNWLTDDHYTNVIDRLRKLSDYFIS